MINNFVPQSFHKLLLMHCGMVKGLIWIFLPTMHHSEINNVLDWSECLDLWANKFFHFIHFFILLMYCRKVKDPIWLSPQCIIFRIYILDHNAKTYSLVHWDVIILYSTGILVPNKLSSHSLNVVCLEPIIRLWRFFQKAFQFLDLYSTN